MKINVSAYWQLMRLDKPIGILLLLWPTVWALWIAADGVPDIKILVIFIAGVVVMRSAGCVINDFADRKVDGNVKRTQMRPIVSGAVSAKQALILFFSLLFVALLLVLQLNHETQLLSLGAAALATLYPFMKRYTHLPQVVLGAAFSWGIPMSFSAINGEVASVAWWIFITNLIWTVAYDTQYAMVDRDDDLKIGVKSTAILFGRYDRLIIGGLQILTLALLARIGLGLGYEPSFYIAVMVAAGFFIYQQVLIKDRERQKCFKGFLNNHYVGMVVALGIAVQYLPVDFF